MIAAGLAMNVVELVNAAAHYAAPLDTYRPTLNSNRKSIFNFFCLIVNNV